MSREQGVSLSRWVIAILVGVPVAAGAFYLIRKRSKTYFPDQNGTCKKEKTSSETVKKSAESKEIPIEEGPLERSLKLKNAGNVFYKKGEYTEAVRCYTEAISVCPPAEREQLATFYQNRAAAYEALNNTEKVLEDCSSAIDMKRDYLKARLRRYKAAEKLGQMQRALEDVTALCLLEKFGNRDSLAAADRILQAIGSSEGKKFMKSRQPVLPSDYFIKAYFASYTQDPVTKDLAAVASAEPILLRGVEKARRALAEGRYAEVTANCDEELANPSSTEAKEKALLLRASMKILTSQTSEAMSDLNLLIASSSDTKIKANALLKRACLYMQVEESQNSFQDFGKAAEIDPTNPDVPHQLAQMYLLGERLEEAVNEFKKASELNPDSGLVQVQKLYAEYRLGVTRENTALAAKARAGLQEAIKQYATTPEGYMLLAQVYNDTKDFDKAEATFDKGIIADTKNASILVHKGLLYLQWKEDVSKAVDLIEKAIGVDPKCEFAYETLASIEVQRGNLSRAVELFDKALPLAKSEREASHILSLRAAAEAQIVLVQKLDLDRLEASHTLLDP